ncbi:MAG: hypothetical protein AAB467_03640 [Patescibacteria group bacterium]
MNLSPFFFNNKGAAALLTVLIIGAAALIMAVSASFLSIGELDLGYTSQKGGEAFALADGCMEDALRHLRLDGAYAGGTLNVGSNSCILSINPSGGNKIVNVRSTVGDYNKEIEVNLTLSGNIITINSWIQK